jgi:hypothetical protein
MMWYGRPFREKHPTTATVHPLRPTVQMEPWRDMRTYGAQCKRMRNEMIASGSSAVTNVVFELMKDTFIPSYTCETPWGTSEKRQ